MDNLQRSAIVLTVGTGDIAHPEATILEPLRKSIAHGRWDKVVLCPSRVTSETAMQLQRELTTLSLDVRPLPQPGMEDDPDACFAHFDHLGELRGPGSVKSSLISPAAPRP